jgi:lactoylglutathione lyase
MMQAHQTNVVDVGGVAVPVSDQDQALRFYVDTLGFEVRLDVPTRDGGRWLQVVAPGGRVPIALVPVKGAIRVGMDTGITLATSDARADHATLVGSGVDADELLLWPGVPIMFAFRDLDGNQLKIMEAPE